MPAERASTPPDPTTAGAGHRSRPADGPPAVLRLPGPAHPSPAPVIAVPGLGLSVDVPARTLRLLQPVVGSTVVALPGYGVPVAHGADKIARFFAAVGREELPPGSTVEIVDVNGGPAAVLVGPAGPATVLQVDLGDDGRIADVRLIGNPDKLGGLAALRAH